MVKKTNNLKLSSLTIGQTVACLLLVGLMAASVFMFLRIEHLQTEINNLSSQKSTGTTLPTGPICNCPNEPVGTNIHNNGVLTNNYCVCPD